MNDILRDYFTRDLRHEKRELEKRLELIQQRAKAFDEKMTATNPPATDGVKLAAYEDLLRAVGVK